MLKCYIIKVILSWMIQARIMSIRMCIHIYKKKQFYQLSSFKKNKKKNFYQLSDVFKIMAGKSTISIPMGAALSQPVSPSRVSSISNRFDFFLQGTGTPVRKGGRVDVNCNCNCNQPINQGCFPRSTHDD